MTRRPAREKAETIAGNTSESWFTAWHKCIPGTAITIYKTNKVGLPVRIIRESDWRKIGVRIASQQAIHAP